MGRLEHFEAGHGKPEYGGLHRPDETGPPLHNLLDQSGEWTLPNDVYDKPHFYTGYTEPAYLQETTRAIKQARGKPHELVTIYRGAPPEADRINRGDWVSLSSSYAADHGKHSDDPSKDWPVISAQVPASHVRFAGDDLMEFGYWGPGAKPGSR